MRIMICVTWPDNSSHFYDFLCFLCAIFVKLLCLQQLERLHPSWILSLFQQFTLSVARRNISKIPLSMCALMLQHTMIPICQRQPWILAKQWRPHLLQNTLCAAKSSHEPPGPVSLCLCSLSVHLSDSYPQAAAWLVAAAYCCCLHKVFSAAWCCYYKCYGYKMYLRMLLCITVTAVFVKG